MRMARQLDRRRASSVSACAVTRRLPQRCRRRAGRAASSGHRFQALVRVQRRRAAAAVARVLAGPHDRPVHVLWRRDAAARARARGRGRGPGSRRAGDRPGRAEEAQHERLARRSTAPSRPPRAPARETPASRAAAAADRGGERQNAACALALGVIELGSLERPDRAGSSSRACASGRRDARELRRNSARPSRTSSRELTGRDPRRTGTASSTRTPDPETAAACRARAAAARSARAARPGLVSVAGAAPAPSWRPDRGSR